MTIMRSTDTDSVSDTVSDTDSVSDTDTDTDSVSDTVSDTDSVSDTDTDSVPVSDTDTVMQKHRLCPPPVGERPTESHQAVCELQRWLDSLCINIAPRHCEPKLHSGFCGTPGCDAILVQPIATHSLRSLREVRGNRGCCATKLHRQVPIVLCDLLDQRAHCLGKLEGHFQCTESLHGKPPVRVVGPAGFSSGRFSPWVGTARSKNRRVPQPSQEVAHGIRCTGSSLANCPRTQGSADKDPPARSRACRPSPTGRKRSCAPDCRSQQTSRPRSRLPLPNRRRQHP